MEKYNIFIEQNVIPTIKPDNYNLIDCSWLELLCLINDGVDIKTTLRKETSRSSWVHKNANVVNSYLGEGVKVFEGCTVRDSIILDNTVVGHCSEVARSVILNECSIPRFNYIGGSLLGEEVRIGGCVSLATRRHDDAKVEVRFADILWETGRYKFGSIIGSKTRIGFSTHLNPGVVIGYHSLIGPLIDLKNYIPSGSLVTSKQQLRIDNISDLSVF